VSALRVGYENARAAGVSMVDVAAVAAAKWALGDAVGNAAKPAAARDRVINDALASWRCIAALSPGAPLFLTNTRLCQRGGRDLSDVLLKKAFPEQRAAMDPLKVHPI